MRNLKQKFWILMVMILVAAARIASAQTPTPQSVWDISGGGDATIQGYAVQMSYNLGETAQFKINTDASAYHLDIYRIGYYAGNGAALIASITPSATLPQVQPNCISDAATRLIDCGNWALSASWAIPANAKSGVYFARLIRNDTLGASHIFFVVRNDASTSAILFQTSDTTWQAYNQYGGASLYGGTGANAYNSALRAYKVSYNRPITTRAWNNWSFFFDAEFPMIRWLEANGYDVSYTSGIDTDQRGSLITNHKVFLTAGHDEYWSAGQRANVLAARNAGVNMMFLSGNDDFWKTRYENSIDGSSTAYRTLVCYKETHANAKIDPTATWTGTWRDPRFSPPADGGSPENQLTGTIFSVNDVNPGLKIQVPDTDGKMRFWRNTNIATLASGTTASLTSDTLGVEWNEALDNGYRPGGLIYLSTATYNVPSYLLDYGSTYGPGTATHHMTMYKASSGALVFSAGSMQFAWGMDATHDGPSNPTADTRLQQAIVNLLADMSVQPTTLQSGLVAATKTTDTLAPSSVIVAPSSGASVAGGSLLTISGTATDAGGGVVAAVEVSVDGGLTWHPATGRASWSYTWVPSGASATIKSRSIDDSGNIQTTPTSVSVTITNNTYTIWNGGGAPVIIDASDTNAVELGVKFKSDVAGVVTGVLFYKSVNNTGTHVGNLWSSAGALLATVTFAGETASGWQQASFSTPVAISANTTYVISYHTNVGHYSATSGFFASVGVDSAPLHALSNAAGAGNGLYLYGAGGFPSQTYNSANYWVDVAFQSSVSNPVISAVTATPSATLANITWNTDIPSDSKINYGTSPASLTSTVTSATLTTSHALSLTGLTAGTVYYYTVTSTGTTLNSSTYPASPAAPATFTTLTSPVVISAINVVPTATSATITWTTNVASSSRVDFGASTGTLTQNQSNASLVTSHTIVLTGLSATSVYYYRVTSVDNASNSTTIPTPPAAPSSFTTLDNIPPVISAIAATPGAGGLAVITWNTDEASTSRVDYGTATGSLTLNSTNASLVISHSITLSGLTQGTTYYYRVTSADASNNSATSPASPAAPNSFAENVAVVSSTIFSPSSAPVNINWNDPSAVELGVKFQSDVAGQVSAVRFYKGSQDIGTHIGNLWNTAGQLLGTVTFTNETASGWQQANFAVPVSINANTTYVVSYHTNGHYAGDGAVFTNAGIDNPPLHALSNAAAGGNGVYLYGAGGYPNQFYNASNYWVDLVLQVAPAVPAITSFTPTSGNVGSSVVITGTNFTGAFGVTFNGVTAPAFTVNSATQITVTVPTGATTGAITVTTPAGTATSAAIFTVTVPPVPTITSFSPTSGTVGTSVVIAGTNFTGATVVSFNNVPAVSYTVNSSAQITAIVPSGATSGLVRVTVPGGTATSASNFTVTVPPIPTITSFSPTSGPIGTSVVITGTNFTGSSAVSFNNVAAASFTVNSATQITVTVPTGATTGTIKVTAPGGTGTSASSYTVTAPVIPIISSFSPASGLVGTSVVITGSNFTGATVVSINNIAASFTLNSATQITAVVPSGASTGLIRVTSPGGTGTSVTNFSVILTFFTAAQAPANVNWNDPSAVELGVKFRVDNAATVTGIRFFKGSLDVGTHIGNLWTSTGVLLGTVTFTGESASGWQQANFASPIAISANTTYIISYHTSGFYAGDGFYFSAAGVNNGPLHALQNGVDGGNGVYLYGAGGFPSLSWNSSNYWVDVVLTVP